MTTINALPATISEADFQRCILDLAKLKGWMCHHSRPSRTGSGSWATALTGHPGLPDLVLARRGIVLLAELKRATGKTTPGQRQWLTALGPHGRLWTPGMWPQIVAELAARPVDPFGVTAPIDSRQP